MHSPPTVHRARHSLTPRLQPVAGTGLLRQAQKTRLDGRVTWTRHGPPRRPCAWDSGLLGLFGGSRCSRCSGSSSGVGGGSSRGSGSRCRLSSRCGRSSRCRSGRCGRSGFFFFAAGGQDNNGQSGGDNERLVHSGAMCRCVRMKGLTTRSQGSDGLRRRQALSDTAARIISPKSQSGFP